jgi:hypothetical protein
LGYLSDLPAGRQGWVIEVFLCYYIFMKRLLFLLTFISFLSFTTLVSAHMPGQPSFFVINGKYADFYPGALNTMPNPDAPQDIGPEKYEANKQINFGIDFTKFPQVTPEHIKQTKFNWTFGDGDTGSGGKNTHVYKKTGKYVLKIMADDGTTPVPQLFESIEIEIIPNKDEEARKAYLMYGLGGLGIIITLAIFGIIKKRK